LDYSIYFDFPEHHFPQDCVLGRELWVCGL